MANGRAAKLDDTSPLANEEWISIADLTGAGPVLRIVLASRLEASEAEELGGLSTESQSKYDPKLDRVSAKSFTRLGAITLSQTPQPKPQKADILKALVQYVRTEGLKVLDGYGALVSLENRLQLLHQNHDPKWPETFLTCLKKNLDDWLPLALEGVDGFQKLQTSKLVAAAKTQLEWNLLADLDKLAPETWQTPTERKVEVNYTLDQGPVVRVKVQEVFGLQHHPTLMDNRLPVTLELLSPALRPIATTKNIADFWDGGYVDLRKDMRGRYPKHDWPEDPSDAQPQRGAKKKR
jgi:ATP-dependent helicase HrpB